MTFYLLFAMELKSRRVQFVGFTVAPNEQWIKQTARELTAFDDGFLNGKKYVIMDRYATFCQSFRTMLTDEGIEPIRLPPRSPNLNAYVERFFSSLKSECLERMIFFGENSLRNAVREVLSHYHQERNHQGLENKVINPAEDIGPIAGEIKCRDRLGGMLRYYYRDAA